MGTHFPFGVPCRAPIWGPCSAPGEGQPGQGGSVLAKHHGPPHGRPPERGTSRIYHDFKYDSTRSLVTTTTREKVHLLGSPRKS